MTTNDLEIFSVTYSCQSFSQAAEKLFMSPQGIAKTITRIESELNIYLFERTKRGIIPTIFAERLYQKTKDLKTIFNDISSLQYTVHSDKEIINIFSTYGVLAYLGFQLFRDFQEKYPQYVLNIVEFPDSALSIMFKDNYANIGFVTGPVDFEKSNSLYIGSNRYVAVVSGSNSLASKKSLSLEDLSDIELAIKGKEYNIFNKNTNNFLKYNLSPNVVLETSEESFILEFAKLNLGVGITTDYTESIPHFQELFKTGQLVSIPINDINFSRDLFYIELMEVNLTEGEKAFKKYIQTIFPM